MENRLLLLGGGEDMRLLLLGDEGVEEEFATIDW